MEMIFVEIHVVSIFYIPISILWHMIRLGQLYIYQSVLSIELVHILAAYL